MAWTTLSFPFGSILTSTKMTQLYDNLTALANGDSGAPRVKTAAIEAFLESGASVYHLLRSGLSQTIYSYASGTRNATSYAKVSEVTIPGGHAGDLTVRMQLSNQDGNTTYGTIYVNGTAVGTERSAASSGFTTFDEVITGLAPGDTVELWIRVSAVGTYGGTGRIALLAGTNPVQMVITAGSGA